ncbi:MAG: AzlC family ABC transporter permease [Deltaproteobacteria bacterium]|nr:AzlC family ABC transporter permease [Deltaproteobacteria bacterium]
MTDKDRILTAEPQKGAALKRVLADGMAAAWPICLGYFPIGLAFGVIAQKSGLSPLEIGFMSLVVFAGSSQFIGVSMLAAGAGVLSIVATTFVVNIRHLLMSSALALHLDRPGRWWLTLFSYGVTDESFALNLARFHGDGWDWRRALVLNHTANATWIAATVIGGYGGELIPEGAFGMDFALTAMFLCLLVFQLRGRIHVVVALLAGGISVVLATVTPGNGYIIAAAVTAATAGLFLKRKRVPRTEGLP